MANQISAKFQKRETAVLDYQVNWATWLGSDTIATSTWTVETGITKNSSTNTTLSATVWLSGGTVDESYEIVNTITTAGGRTDYRTIEVEVID